MNQVLIIGAGISGLTAGRILADKGYKVTIFEKRSHIGGNIYDYYENGVLVHKYGPHLFHTRLPEVAEFVKRFSAFFSYEHRVLGEVEGRLVPIPFNFTGIDMLYCKEEGEHLKEVLKKAYPDESNVPIMELRKHGDKLVQKLAEFVYQNVFYGYTKKQWGKSPEEMDQSVMGRVPVRMSYDDRYFPDEFQMMPVHGYTKMMENMAAHKNISIRYECDAFSHISLKGEGICLDGEAYKGHVIYTGCIEELGQLEFGKLPYRSLKFVLEHKFAAQAQPVVQINYPNRFTYTRTSEFKLVQPEPVEDRTIVVYEYPMACGEGDVPYYPIESEENRARYNKYKKKLSGIPNLYLLGRLAEYQYYNMDLTIYQAMKLAQEIITKEENREKYSE